MARLVHCRADESEAALTLAMMLARLVAVSLYRSGLNLPAAAMLLLVPIPPGRYGRLQFEAP
jgi:hypothetical protein